MFDITAAIISADPYRQVQLIRTLDQGERKALFNIDREQSAEKTDRICRSIIEKIEVVNKAPNKITQRRHRRSIIAWAKKKTYRLVGDIAYLFGYLTVSKTRSLVNRSLRSSPSDSSAHSATAGRLNRIITQQRLKYPDSVIDLKTLLVENGYPTVISDCTFDRVNIFQNVNLEGITFNHCEFDWAHFSNSSLKNVRFESCQLLNVSFMKSNIESCEFYDCVFQEVMFTGSELNGITFLRCAIIGSAFEDANISNCLFILTQLPATHFLDASITKSHFIRSNLKDTVFFGTLDQFKVDIESKRTAIVSGPTTAMLINPEERGFTTPKAYMKLEQSAHMIPNRITAQYP
ncbi:MAG: Pentapeptide repeat protein, partial [Chlamydiae bacterium]|nr:Pentapeptide repeat protein [Chlamydiota bacterium]